MTTAWSGAELPEKLRGVTVSLSVDFVDTARGEDLTGVGRVVRRGRTLTSCEVDVRGAGQRIVAKGIVTYKVG
jgi:acyl-coenzyme A thioesterase PaaI-like protein